MTTALGIRYSPLITDLYQLTMAYGYWKHGRADHEAVFHLTFRQSPFGGEFAVAAGLQQAIELCEQLRFESDDLQYLAGLEGADGLPLFEPAFLEDLADFEFRCDLDGVREGTVVFPHEPMLRVVGPILQAQLIETALLTLINFQTLIATKAARVTLAADGDDVLEFGLRRAQGLDGGVSASRAAYIGGCAATSNVIAGKLYGIPVRGTHAHSWVMTFDSELESFQAYAEALPNNSVFLVDTYDTEQGVRNAIEVGRGMREQGHEMLGIRLDSGDMTELSRAARTLLDDAGFPDAAIVASNELDEYRIARHKRDGAKINVWGVGTRLATAYEQPALGGVYKLSAIREDRDEPWRMKVKLSEEEIKVSNPGLQQVRRFAGRDGYVADMIYDTTLGCPPEGTYVNLAAGAEYRYEATTPYEDLLTPIFREGRRVYDSPPTVEIRDRTLNQLAQLPKPTRRLERPAPYPVGLERRLYDCKQELIARVQKVQT